MMNLKFKEILIVNNKSTLMISIPDKIKNADYVKKLVEKTDKMFTTGIFEHKQFLRQYTGIWELKVDKLYLRNIKGVFGLRIFEPLFANWFSGILKLPKGKILKKINSGFHAIFEEEIHITIKSGKMKLYEIIDNRERYYDERNACFWDIWKLQ